ncbi:uncharacterized protein LOC141825248 isoform X2 [Curcuma longa]|uniref:uncharacterized protein LOC141825248 isoform X2 n=1 Tax=Curcuma longa TaxID=136217 RepID=UPI003D9E683B
MAERLLCSTGMKGSGAITVASTVITAAASYSTASLSDAKPDAPSCQEQELASWKQQQRRRPPSATTEERFAPRFDGLRFVETLVTAHR